MPFKSVSVANTTPLVVANTQAGVSERVRLTGGFLVAANTVSVTFQNVSDNSAVSGTFTLIAGTPLVLPSSPADPCSGERPGYLQTVTNSGLQLVLGSNVQVSGSLEYVFCQ